jgi:hypothetical protein
VPQADTKIKNHEGEHVWLKRIKGGVTECCPVDTPCDYHKRLTHVAPERKQ